MSNLHHLHPAPPARVARSRVHQPGAHEINAERMRTATTAAYEEGRAFGERQGYRTAARWCIASGMVVGLVAGALVRHLLGPLV